MKPGWRLQKGSCLDPISSVIDKYLFCSINKEPLIEFLEVKLIMSFRQLLFGFFYLTTNYFQGFIADHYKPINKVVLFSDQIDQELREFPFRSITSIYLFFLIDKNCNESLKTNNIFYNKKPNLKYWFIMVLNMHELF